MRFALFSTLLLAISCGTFAQQDDLSQKIQQLDWKQSAGVYDVASEDAQISLTDNEFMVLGDDANEYLYLSEGHRGFIADAVKVMVHPEQGNTIAFYQRSEIGFLQTDDWEEHIDADEMLAELKAGTAETNKIREAGHPSLYIDQWVQPPFLDKTHAIIYWAIKGHTSENQSFINAKALKLGRKGYTEIVWSGSPEQFSDAETVLAPVIASYTYNDGFKYQDFVPGTDTVAAMGAGALVYKLATGKVAAKAGFLAVALLFAKKFWFVLFLPFVYGWKHIKARFTRQSV